VIGNDFCGWESQFQLAEIVIIGSLIAAFQFNT